MIQKVRLAPSEEVGTTTEVRINKGVIVPATMVVLNSIAFLFALGATVFFGTGLVIQFPWPNVLKAVLYLFLLSLSLPLTLFSVDWVRRSIGELALGAEEVIKVPRWIGDASRVKSLCGKTLIGYSVAFVFLSVLSFSTAFFRAGVSANVMLFLGWVSVAFGIYTVAVYFDFKRANPD